MNPNTPSGEMETPSRSRIPLWIKMSYTAFIAVLIPAYWLNYGPTNFLYFCDVALLVTLYALWKESSHAASMAAVGILLPQVFWCLDFGLQLGRVVSGGEHTGMTAYMFDATKPLFLRGLSLFHGWLPFLLVFLVARLGYEARALKSWTVTAWSLCLLAFFALPAAGAKLPNPNTPVNINYVFGLDDAKPQEWMPAGVYLVFWMVLLLVLAYAPTHLLLNKLFGNRYRAVR